MKICTHCQKNIDNQAYNFCPHCQQQLYCINNNCRAEIISGKSICLMCGTPVKKVEKYGNMNSLLVEEKYSEKSGSRRIELQATDIAIDKIASVLGTFTSPLGTGIQRKPGFSPNTALPIPRLPNTNLPASNAAKRTVDASSVNSNQQDTEDHEQLDLPLNVDLSPEVVLHLAENFFTKDTDGSIIPFDNLRKTNFGSLEHTSRSKCRSLVLLYILIYESYNKTSPSKEEIYDLIRKEKLYNSNFRDDFTKKISKEYLTSLESDRWTLHFKGRQHLETLVGQIYNPVEISASKRKVKAGRPKGSVNKESNKKIEEWMSKDVDLKSFGTNKLKSATDWALFGYNLLLTSLKVDKTASSGNVYTYLLKSFKTISVRKNVFQDAVSKSKEYFERSAGGEYFLTAEGVAKANNIVDMDSK